jgi:membrane-associated phospholipid phosphatase
MIGLIRKYPLGFMLYALVLAAGTVLVLAVPKPGLHLIMNSNHSPAQDVFFKTITWLGNGWFALVFSLLFLMVRYRYFLMMILSYSISGLMAQLFKHLVFPGAARPADWLEQMPGLRTVPGVDLFHSFSFPSGHATTAFAVLLLAGFILRSRPVFFLAMVFAWCVAFSRVYLSQHFLVDVLAGSLLGTLSALFFYWYFQRLKPAWLDRSLRDLFPGRKKKVP